MEKSMARGWMHWILLLFDLKIITKSTESTRQIITQYNCIGGSWAIWWCTSWRYYYWACHTDCQLASIYNSNTSLSTIPYATVILYPCMQDAADELYILFMHSFIHNLENAKFCYIWWLTAGMNQYYIWSSDLCTKKADSSI